MVDGIQELVNVLQSDTVESSKTYSAEVSRIDNEGTVWVYLEGSTMETPTALSSAEVSVGDYVNVEWRNNKLYIAGNVSNPSAGVVRVTAVEQAAQIANQAAQNAVADADVARQAAETAQATADRVEDIATRAEGYAEDAQASADSAAQSAETAITQLSIVENVVGVLDLLTKNGQYELTVDTEVQEGKWYFVRSGSGTQGDPYIYNAVQTPTGDPNAQGWYELIGINEAIQNYVSSHLVLDNEGLRLQSDASGTSILLSALRGVVLYGTNGTEIASYGSTAIIGNALDFHIEIDNQEIGFYQGSNRVAYMNGAELYVENSLSFGNFVFQQRQNGHFTLKLI